MKVDLEDPVTHYVVLVRQAQLGQSCRMCQRPLLPGDFICNTAGDERGWTHLEHLQTRLMTLPMKETS